MSVGLGVNGRPIQISIVQVICNLWKGEGILKTWVGGPVLYTFI